jgi:hypothetical protein
LKTNNLNSAEESKTVPHDGFEVCFSLEIADEQPPPLLSSSDDESDSDDEPATGTDVFRQLADFVGNWIGESSSIGGSLPRILHGDTTEEVQDYNDSEDDVPLNVLFRGASSLQEVKLDLNNCKNDEPDDELVTMENFVPRAINVPRVEPQCDQSCQICLS